MPLRIPAEADFLVARSKKCHVLKFWAKGSTHEESKSGIIQVLPHSQDVSHIRNRKMSTYQYSPVRKIFAPLLQRIYLRLKITKPKHIPTLSQINSL